MTDRAEIHDDGKALTLSLDKASGSGFQSKNEYLFGKLDMQIKLVPGNSAGIVTAYYVSPPPPLSPPLFGTRKILKIYIYKERKFRRK